MYVCMYVCVCVCVYVCVYIYIWCNKGHGVYYSVCGMLHIKEPLLLIRKSSLCSSSGFPLSLSEWSFTICLYAIKCVECH